MLGEAKLKLNEVNYITFYEKPFLKFERLLETYVAFAPKGFKSFCKAMPIWLREKLFQKKLLFNELKRHDDNFKEQNKILFSDHHLSHAASAFFPSPFDEAIILTADGVGEWATTTVAVGKGNKLEVKKGGDEDGWWGKALSTILPGGDEGHVEGGLYKNFFKKFTSKKGALVADTKEVAPSVVAPNFITNNSATSKKSIGMTSNSMHLSIRNNDFLYQDV